MVRVLIIVIAAVEAKARAEEVAGGSGGELNAERALDTSQQCLFLLAGGGGQVSGLLRCENPTLPTLYTPEAQHGSQKDEPA